jgi:hypothetical protein
MSSIELVQSSGTSASFFISEKVIRERFKNLAESLDAWVADPQEWWAFQRHQFFVFDDVVFNTMSLLDYLARLAGAVRWNGKSFDWKGLVTHCKRPQHASTMVQLADLVVRAHGGWVKPVKQFRGELIHQEASAQEGQKALDLNTKTVSWDVWFPKELKDKLPEIFGGQPDPMDIVDGALALAHKAITCTTEIVHCTWDTYPVQPRWPARTGKPKLPK